MSAKKWFKGPQVQGTREELLAIERERAAVEAGKDAAELKQLEDLLDREGDERRRRDST